MKLSILPVITAYNKPVQLSAAINRLSNSFRRVVVLDNSTSNSVAEIACLPRKTKVEYLRTGIDVGFDKSLAIGLGQICEDAQLGEFYLLAGDDDDYAHTLRSRINWCVQSLIREIPEFRDNQSFALILGHSNYVNGLGKFVLSAKDAFYAFTGNCAFSPSGNFRIGERYLSSCGTKLCGHAQGSLWAISEESALSFCLGNGIPRYIGIVYPRKHLTSFFAHANYCSFYDTMHLYAAPMVSPILGRDKFKIFYYLPAPLNCPLRYELGPKSWDRAKTYKGINEFANACEAIDCDGVFEVDKFMSSYDWLKTEI